MVIVDIEKKGQDSGSEIVDRNVFLLEVKPPLELFSCSVCIMYNRIKQYNKYLI